MTELESLPAELAEPLAAALAELSGMLVDSQPLEDLLHRVAALAVATVPGCAQAGVTLLDGDRPMTAVCTDDVELADDQQQYAPGDGPCLDSIRRGVVNRVREQDAEQRWPPFIAHARQCGIRSFLAAPLVAGGRAVGALNLYGTDSDSFDALDDALVLLFAGQASVALANAQLYRRATAVNAQLSEAMASRAVIEQAKGVLMGRLGLTPDAAFLELRARSQHENRKLRDVAVDVVQESIHRS